MRARYWDERLETLPPETLARLQRHRLNWQLRRCWDGSPFYRERLEAAGLGPALFASAEILSRLPILSPAELVAETQAAPPFGRLTVAPEAWWVETDADVPGPPRVWTDGDVAHRADLAARALWAAGARPDRAIGLPDHVEDERLARALREGAARILAGADGRDGGACAESISPSQVLSRPLVGPILAYECAERRGLHWAEDHFLVEVIDPATRMPLPPGATGQVVVTELTREGSPLLRLALDLEASVVRTPCACGRTAARTPLTRSVG